MIVEKIIQIRRYNDQPYYISIAHTKNSSGTLFLVGEFLRLYEKEVKFGIYNFKNYTLSKDGFRIEYGDKEYGDDYYVSFTHDMFDKQCEDENGWVDVDCLPRLKFSYENFDHILQTWVRLQESKPKYLIIVKHESGWIDIWAREELSEEEKQLIEESEGYARNRQLLKEEGLL